MPIKPVKGHFVGRFTLLLSSIATIILVSLYAFGGPHYFWQFVETDVHRITAQQMLAGHLTYPWPLVGGLARNDIEIFNGAQFTHWGFGVPLLQLPFHWLARFLPGLEDSNFFPDRAIFFLYLSGCLALLFLAIYHVLQWKWPSRSNTYIAPLAVTATLGAAGLSIFPLIAGRFIVYEETVAYFGLCELGCLACYLIYTRSGRRGWAAAAGFLAGFGLLTRHIGAIYLPAWGICLFFSRRDKGSLKYYCVGSLPLVAFWMVTNYLKAGSPLSLGFQNSSPYYAYQFDALRFGTSCSQTWSGFWAIAGQLTTGLFLQKPSPSARLSRCFFRFETYGSTDVFPLMGWPPLMLLLISTAYFLWRHHKRWDLFLPLSGVLALLGAYTHAGIGFAERYTADFWPFLLMGASQALALHDPRRRFERVTLLLMGGVLPPLFIAWQFQSRLVPSHRNILSSYQPQAKLPVRDKAKVFYVSQYPFPDTLASNLACHDNLYPIYGNGLGWNADCSVGSLTNLFLGLPEHKDSAYRLTFSVSNARVPNYIVYINGRLYDARREGNNYTVDFPIGANHLYSRNIQVTIRWTDDWSSPQQRLTAVRIVRASR